MEKWLSLQSEKGGRWVGCFPWNLDIGDEPINFPNRLIIPEFLSRINQVIGSGQKLGFQPLGEGQSIDF